MPSDRKPSLILPIFIALAMGGCGSPAEPPDLKSVEPPEPAPVHRSRPPKHVHWDFSKSRHIDGLSWSNSRPFTAAVQGDRASDRKLEVDIVFDENRSYRGPATLVVFEGADDDKTRVRWVAINLPAQSASDVIKTLYGLAKDWGLSDERLKEQEHLIRGPPVKFLMSSGIVLFSRGGTSEISVELGHSFDDDRPWFITLEWSFEPFTAREGVDDAATAEIPQTPTTD